MNGDIKGQALVGPAKEPGREYQMGRAGNGQKLSDSLYERERDDLQPIHGGQSIDWQGSATDPGGLSADGAQRTGPWSLRPAALQV